MFTVEYPATGEPAATIGLIRGKRAWRLDQMKGAQNGDVDEVIARVGTVVLGRYQSRG
jgi:hypothetical protein